MAVIRKKIWPEQFEGIFSGKKTFDLRLDDFDIQGGDTLVLEEYDRAKKEYTGRKIEKKVGYVFKFHPHKLPFYTEDEVHEKGFQIISLF